MGGNDTRGTGAFWFASGVTRPLGASFADYFGRPRSLTGASFGSGRVAVIVAIIVAMLVADLAVTRHDIQPPADLQADPPMRPALAPGSSPRRGYRW